MRIALVSGAHPPEFLGGTELAVAARARELVARGHEVVVVCGSAATSAGYHPREERIEGVRVVRLPKTEVERGRAHWRFARLARLVDQATHGHDLVHLHHWQGLSGDLVRRIARRVPVVVTLHDAHASCPRSFRAPVGGERCPRSRPTDACARCVTPLLGGEAPDDLVARLGARWADFRAELGAAARVLTPSAWLRDALAGWMELDPGSWEVVPHGLCRPLERLAPSPSSGELRVLSFGNRARAKGVLDLVRALAALPAGSARLALLGAEVEPGLDAELRAAAGDLPLELHGAYGPELLAEVAARSDLAAFPSLAAESYGLVVEEALALGLPVWVSDRGALPEVLTDAAGRGPLPGGVLPAGRPEAWTEALRRLVARPGRLHDARALVPAALRTVASAVERELQVYAEALHTEPVREP